MSVGFDALELYTQEEFRRAIEDLRERRSVAGKLTAADLAPVVVRSGRSVSTVRRRIRDGFQSRRPGRFTLTTEMKVLIVRNGGDVAATVRRNPAVFNRGVRTVQLAVRELGDAASTSLRKGERAARQLELAVVRHYTERNEAWFIDAFFCRRRVMTSNGRGIRDAWAFVIVDGASGLIVAITAVRIELRDDGAASGLDTQDALHAVGEGMRAWEQIGPGQGRPLVLFHDNQPCFSGRGFQLPLSDPLIGIRLQATPPWEARQNGRAESAIGSLRKLLARPLEDGSYQLLNGQPLVARDRNVIPFEDLIAELKAAAIEYNQLRWRDGARLSKADAYRSLPGEIRPLPRELLSRFLRRAEVYVYTTGARLESQLYMHPRLHTLVNRRVEVRYRDMDDQFVEVYFAGKFVCVAKNVRDMTDEERERVYLARSSTRQSREQLLAEAARSEEEWAEERRLASGQRNDTEAPAGRMADPFGEDVDDA
jgi:hypothetical protein